MIRYFLILVCLTVAFEAGAQQYPIFKNRKDSVQYAQIVNLFRFRSPTDTITFTKHYVDSLSNVLQQLRPKAIGWTQLYQPRSRFISYDDLKAGKANPDTIKQLSISGLRSVKVPAEVLACKNLEELELVNTQIDELQDELNTLTHLTSIYLYNNIPSKKLILGKNNHVTYLRIAGHSPEKLPATYKNFASLDSLNLNRSMATQLPNIKKNNALTLLYAGENNITLKRYKGSASLVKLELRGNKITKVPNSISRKFKSLKALSFNSNQVKKVKPGLGKLKNLEYLSFYANGITEIPQPVYKLKNLKSIDLFHNEIEFLSPQIKNLQQLEVLHLANNRLYRLPDEIGSLKNLQELYIYNNRLDTLPASMDQLKKLRILWVNDNFFHTIPATAWRVGKMDYLDASQNFIKKLPDELSEAPLSVLILSGTLINKERENPELFEKLRKQGTRIIYYRVASESSAENEF